MNQHDYDLTISVRLNHTSEEMSMLRRAFDGDHVECPFKRVTDVETPQHVADLRDALGDAIEWGQVSEDDYKLANAVYQSLGDLLEDVHRNHGVTVQ